jgi:hypothetical protein
MVRGAAKPRVSNHEATIRPNRKTLRAPGTTANGDDEDVRKLKPFLIDPAARRTILLVDEHRGLA